MLEIVDRFNAVNFSADSARFETGAAVVVVADDRTASVSFPETDASPGTGSKRTTQEPPGA